jgi:hypothetical protein
MKKSTLLNVYTRNNVIIRYLLVLHISVLVRSEKKYTKNIKNKSAVIRKTVRHEPYGTWLRFGFEFLTPNRTLPAGLTPHRPSQP